MLKDVLTRKDLEIMLSASNILNAVKSIGDKPLGIFLYENIYGRRVSLKDVFKLVDSYTYRRINTVVSESKRYPHVYKPLSIFLDFFELANSVPFISALLNNRSPSIIYPLGFLPSIIDSEGVDLESLYYSRIPRRLKIIIEDVLRTNKITISSVIRYMPTLNEARVLPSKALIIYGVFNDLFHLKYCLVEEIVEPNLIVLFGRDEFHTLCRQKGLEGLLNTLYTGNNYSKDLSSILNVLKGMNTSFSILDSASIIYSSYRSKDLLSGSLNSVLRFIILSLGESFYVRGVFNVIESGLYRQYYEELIKSWWPI